MERKADSDQTSNKDHMETKRIIGNIFGLGFITLALGCAPQVIPAGPDTYTVSSSGAGFSAAGVRAKVYQTANDFCASRGLVMVPISIDARVGVLGQRPPSADLVFRALKPGDPEIKRPNLEGPSHIERIEVR
ncbi:MAG: hypothetical protein ABIS50_14800 [Luteolibacter sp.]|uniref:hypothetical protein n=1 Tax=Luteolibacter sp. TaxID=1962973 RepID=UPI003265BFFB